jgi:hypothetical protein
MTSKTKQLLIVIVIIVVAFIGYNMFFVNKDGSNTTLTSDNGSTPQFVDGQAILILLGKLNNVKLDDTLFSNSVFASLVSFQKPIEDQVPGRKNPFAPIGTDNVTQLAPRATTTNAR